MRIPALLLLLPTILAAQARPTDKLGWFAGCWERRTQTGMVEEHWSAANGGMLLGFSRTVRRDTVVTYEQLRVSHRGDTLIYHASPAGQQPTDFRAVGGNLDEQVTFENPAHDFPQRIIYRKVGTDSLVARIEGMRGGQLRGIDFRFARGACPAG